MRNLQFLLLCLLPCLPACEQVQEQALLDLTSKAVSGQPQVTNTIIATNIIFQSTDGGQNWRDISAGLPAGISPSSFFAADGELFLSDFNGLYRNRTAATSAGWEKERSLGQPLTSVSAGMGGVIAFSRNGRFFQKLTDTGLWMPVFTNFKNPLVRSVFTAGDGSVFISCDTGIFKSADRGKNWKQVMQGGWAIEMVESAGVLLCTSERGILRSTDGGENWEVVLYEGGVGIDVATIEGGFAAITYSDRSKSRRIRISTDGGQTWRPIDAGLPPSMLISSIQQLGDVFYCGHPDGIYRSADQGKSWELLLPTIGEKVFNLSVADGLLYAVLREGGC